MNIFSKLLKALGFERGNFTDDEELSENELKSLENNQGNRADTAEYRGRGKRSDLPIAEELFDGVLKVFNEALPEFMQRSIDTDAQRKQLVDMLDDTLKDRIGQLAAETRKTEMERLADERSRVADEMKQLKQLNQTLDERQRETTAAKLSAERQKRALTERVRDLENQISKLEAENEQLTLEVKSMSNRMRAASVTGSGDASLKEEIKALEEQLQQKQKQCDEITEHDKMVSAMVNSLQAKAAELNKALAEEKRRADDAATPDNIRIEEFEKQLAGFEEVKLRYEQRIAQLKEENDKLRADAAKARQPKEASHPKPRKQNRKAPRITAIDEFLESSDWFGAPTEEENRQKTEAERNNAEDDFGYKAPPRKQMPENENQLSLF